MHDDRSVPYYNFTSMEEVHFGEFAFIKIVCTGKEVYLNPARVKEMIVTGE